MKKCSIKKYGINSIIMLGVSSICIGILLRQTGLQGLYSELRKAIPIWLVLGIGCMFVYWLIESIIQYMLVHKMHRQGASFWNAFKVVMTGQFFNAITPFSSGGQPMQAFVMLKQGIPVGTSASILMIKFIVYQISLTVYSIVVLLTRLEFFYTHVNGLVSLALIGFAVNGAVVWMLLMATFKPEWLKKISFYGINLLVKLRILKEGISLKKKVVGQVNLFKKSIQSFKESVGLLMPISMLTLVQLTAYFIIPYAVYRAFGLRESHLILLLSAAAFIVMFSSFIPTPGGAGVAEGGFFLFFQLFFPQTILPTAVLCWRMVTFYMPLCLGGIMTALPNEYRRS